MRNKNISKFFAGILAIALAAGVLTAPVDTVWAQSATATVRTQKQLNSALKKSSVRSIVIKTSKSTTFKIAEGDYDEKKLVVNSPKSTVKNYARFDEITIRDGSAFYERGCDNDVTISDPNKLKFVAGKNSYDTEVEIKSSGAKITIVNNGGLEELEVKGSSDITLRGNSTQPLEVENEASGAKFTAKIKTDFSLDADATIKLEKGAEGSTVELDEAYVKASVSNNTTKSVKVRDYKGKASTVAPGKKL